MKKSHLIIISKNKEGKFVLYDVVQEKKYKFKNADDILAFIQKNYVKTKGSYPVIIIPTLKIVIGPKSSEEDIDNILESTMHTEEIYTKLSREDFDKNTKFTNILYYIFKEEM
jgi:hypothetical protein